MDLPEAWEKRQIRDIGRVVTGRTPRTKHEEFYGGDYNLISPADLDNVKYVVTSHKKLSHLGFQECHALPRNSVLVGCIGNVGKIGMVADEQSATNQQINAIICNEDNDPDFIYYCLSSNRTRLEQAADKTTLPILNKTNFQNFELAVPTLTEQQKIASILGLAHSALEQQKRLRALTAELKKALLRQVFSEGLRGEPLKKSDIGSLPQTWKVEPLGDYVNEAQYGLSAKGSAEGSCALLRMTNQQHGRISADNLQYVDLNAQQFDKFRLEKGDILFNRTNSHDLVGRTAIFDLVGDFVFASYLIRLRTKTDGVRPHFLNHYLNWNETQLRLKSIAARSVSQSNISAGRLRGFPVPIPSLDEQDEIIEIIDCVDGKLAAHDAATKLHEELFGTMLHALMTARIRVPDLDFPELETAAAV